MDKLAEITITWPTWPILDRFWAKMANTRFFQKSENVTHEAATLCKKVEKSYKFFKTFYEKNQKNPMTGFG